jgi:hypothetical protein
VSARSSFPAPVRLGGDVGHGTFALDQIADRVAVICLVGQHDGTRRKIIEQDIGGTAVGDVAAGQQEAERATLAVGERVELAVSATSADPDRLGERPPFPPPAERCAFMSVLSIGTSAGGPLAAASVTNISCQMPFAAHRTNRLKSVFLGP